MKYIVQPADNGYVLTLEFPAKGKVSAHSTTQVYLSLPELCDGLKSIEIARKTGDLEEHA